MNSPARYRHSPLKAGTLREPDADPEHVPEALVQDLWAQQRFDRSDLRTTAGRPVVVLDPGRLNTDSGPDFSEARLLLDGQEHRGDVEVHVRSGVWREHGHERDPRYDTVVLHVVLRTDLWSGTLRRADGALLPELALYPRLDAPLRRLLHAFHTRHRSELPCAEGWPRVPEAVHRAWLAQLADERLADRVAAAAAATRRHGHAEEALHEALFAGLGYAKNTEAMAELARRLPNALVRPIEDARDLEAIHFGVAGLLPTPSDLLHADRATADYAVELSDRFDRLRHRLDLRSMPRTTWRFFRLRPANFPTLRIAQAVAFLSQGGLLTEKPLFRLAQAAREPDAPEALRSLLQPLPSPFWQTHVRLDRPTRARFAGVGRARAEALLTNAVLPLLILHARRHDPGLMKSLGGLLRLLSAPDNEVTRRFRRLGTPAGDAFEAQGQHQLYRKYCTQARCLTCDVGRALLHRLA